MLRSCVIAAALFYSSLPAGDAEPLLVRTVTLGGVTGPAYYSSLEQGYRFVGGRPLGASEGDPIALSSLEASFPDEGIDGAEADAAEIR